MKQRKVYMIRDAVTGQYYTWGASYLFLGSIEEGVIYPTQDGARKAVRQRNKTYERQKNYSPDSKAEYDARNICENFAQVIDAFYLSPLC